MSIGLTSHRYPYDPSTEYLEKGERMAKNGSTVLGLNLDPERSEARGDRPLSLFVYLRK